MLNSFNLGSLMNNLKILMNLSNLPNEHKLCVAKKAEDLFFFEELNLKEYSTYIRKVLKGQLYKITFYIKFKIDIKMDALMKKCLKA